MRASHTIHIKPLGAFANGRFQPTPAGRLLERRSPADPNDVIGLFPVSEQAVELAVASAARAAASFGAMPLSDRLALLESIAAPLAARTSELAMRMQREQGRPPWECQREARALGHRLEHILQQAPRQLDERAFQGGTRVVSRPLGVVGVLGPAMLPLANAHAQILAALAAGNTVVFKPSEECPATAQLYAEILGAAKLPAGVFNLVQGDHTIGQHLIDQPEVDAVVAFGRPETTRAVAERCAATGKKAILHPGGKSVAVVLADADLSLAAYELVTSAFLSAGQRCTAISRAYVDRRVMAPLAEMVTHLARHLRVGPPSARVFMGPMLSPSRLERFSAERACATRDGAEVLLAGQRLDRPGAFLSPSVHRAPVGDGAYATRELFGPDLALVEIDELDEATARIGAGAGWASFFSASDAAWQRFAASSRAGMLLKNRGTTAISGALPTGGATRGGADAILALRREITVDGRGGTAEPEIFPGTIDALPDDDDHGDDNDDHSDGEVQS